MDEEKPQVTTPRPREVLYAFWLTIASLAVGILAIPLRSEVVRSQLIIFTIIGLLISLAFTLVLFYLILNGKNWARMFYTITFLIGVPFAFPAILVAFQKTPVLAVIRLLQLFLQMMAVVLLLQKSTRVWFTKLKLQKLMNYQLT